MDYYNRRNNNFSATSCILGGISLLTVCTGIFSIPLGALGMLFAALSKRDNKMDPTAKLGCVLSGIGLDSGLVLTIFVYVSMFFTMFNNIDYSKLANMTEEQAMDYMMESMYGPEYEAYFRSMGIDYDALIDQMY